VRNCLESQIILFGTILLIIWGNWQFLTNHVSGSELEELAQAVTVRVFSEEDALGRGGSGVLIRREGQQYTVVTNHHVLINSSLHYQVQTPDGSFYPGKILAVSQSENDLALLAFDSPDRSYRVLSLKAEVKGKIGDSILVGGFPFNDNLTQAPKCLLTQGEIVMILPMRSSAF
jgi:S1-C subfamily serine protease